MRRPPKLCQNRYRKSAYVTINGKQIYLGKWGLEEVQAPYDCLIIVWKKQTDWPLPTIPKTGYAHLIMK